MVERLDQVEGEPVVGRWYLVPTLEAEYGFSWVCWPVLLPCHEDREVVGFPQLHYHVDVRFLSARELYGRRVCDVQVSPIQTTSNLSPWEAPLSSINEDGFGDVVWRRRRCARRMPPFPMAGKPDPSYPEGWVAPWLDELEAAFREVRLGPDRRCPHRGARLDDQPVDADGCVVCPFHGLRWHLESGELRPHDEASRARIRAATEDRILG